MSEATTLTAACRAIDDAHRAGIIEGLRRAEDHCRQTANLHDNLDTASGFHEEANGILNMIATLEKKEKE